ncbi:MAG: hypothetical protein ABI759_28610 [Candidatus Solibacter sp.]
MLQALEQESTSRSRLTAANSRKPAVRPGWKAGKDARAGECTAYTAEANCLTNHLGHCGTDAECTRQITARRDTKRTQGTCA